MALTVGQIRNEAVAAVLHLSPTSAKEERVIGKVLRSKLILPSGSVKEITPISEKTLDTIRQTKGTIAKHRLNYESGVIAAMIVGTLAISALILSLYFAPMILMTVGASLLALGVIPSALGIYHSVKVAQQNNKLANVVQPHMRDLAFIHTARGDKNPVEILQKFFKTPVVFAKDDTFTFDTEFVDLITAEIKKGTNPNDMAEIFSQAHAKLKHYPWLRDELLNGIILESSKAIRAGVDPKELEIVVSDLLNNRLHANVKNDQRERNFIKTMVANSTRLAGEYLNQQITSKEFNNALDAFFKLNNLNITLYASEVVTSLKCTLQAFKDHPELLRGHEPGKTPLLQFIKDKVTEFAPPQDKQFPDFDKVAPYLNAIIAHFHDLRGNIDKITCVKNIFDKNLDQDMSIFLEKLLLAKIGLEATPIDDTTELDSVLEMIKNLCNQPESKDLQEKLQWAHNKLALLQDFDPSKDHKKIGMTLALLVSGKISQDDFLAHRETIINHIKNIRTLKDLEEIATTVKAKFKQPEQ